MTSFWRSWSKPLAISAVITLALIIFDDPHPVTLVLRMLIGVGGVVLVDWYWRRLSDRRKQSEGRSRT